MDQYFISIETSTDICSVALSCNNEVIDFKEDAARNHASVLGVYISELLKKNNITAKNLSAVSVSKGPGSYTGIRIGTSTGKGLAYGAGIKFIAADTMQAMSLHAANNVDFGAYCKDFDRAGARIVSTIDAGRNEIYREIFDFENRLISPCKAEIITSDSFKDISEENTIIFTGNAAEKTADLSKRKNSVVLKDILPSARYNAAITYIAYNNNEFADVAYFEPFYLKDFIATVSKNNVIAQKS